MSRNLPRWDIEADSYFAREFAVRMTVKVFTPCSGCTVIPPMLPEPEGPVIKRPYGRALK